MAEKTETKNTMAGQKAHQGNDEQYNRCKDMIARLGWTISCDQESFNGHRGAQEQEVAETEGPLQKFPPPQE